MQIYEALKDLISKEQLEEFQAEVKSTVEEAVDKKRRELETISESYVNEAVAEQVKAAEQRIEEKYKAEYEKKQAEVEAARAEVDTLKESLEAEYAEKESQLVALYEDKNTELETEFAEKEAKLAEEYENKSTSLETEYQTKNDTAEATMKEDAAALKEGFEAKVKAKEDELVRLYEEKEAELEAEYEEKAAALAEKEERLEEEHRRLEEDYRAELEEQLMAEGVVTKEKFEQFTKVFEEKEGMLVEMLNNFLDEQIREKISDRLIRESVASEELESLVSGIKVLFEEHYSGIDETAGIRKIREENKELKEAYERLTGRNADLSQKLEMAATKLLITEKTKDLSDVQTEKVTTYFEGRDFDFVKDRIDNFITLTESEGQSKKVLRSERRIQRLDEVNSGCLPERKPSTRETDFFKAVDKYM